MVKILQCPHFISQHVCSPKHEPVLVNEVNEASVFLSTADSDTEVWNLSQATISPVQQLLPQAGCLTWMSYLQNFQCLCTVETGPRGFHGSFLKVYHNWNPDLEKPSSKNDESLPIVRTFASEPSACAADTDTACVALAFNHDVHIYDGDLVAVAIVHTDVENIKIISLCHDCLAFGNEQEVATVTICKPSHPEFYHDDIGSETNKYLIRDIIQKRIGDCETYISKDLATQAATQPCSNALQFSALDPPTRIKQVSLLKTLKTQNETNSPQTLCKDDEHCVNVFTLEGKHQPDIPVASLPITTERPTARQKTAGGRDEFHLGLTDKVINHIITAADPSRSSPADVNLQVALYQSFKNSAVTGLQLQPVYVKDHDGNLLSIGILLLIGTPMEGLLYSIKPDTQLIQKYPFASPVLQVCIDDTFLYSLTESSLEVYAMFHHTTFLQQLGFNYEVFSGGNHEPCLISVQSYISPEKMMIGENYLLLKTKYQDDDVVLSTAQQNNISVWNLYALKKPSPTDVCAAMEEQGLLHEDMNHYYLYILQHMFHFAFACLLNQNYDQEDDHLQTVFRNICSQLFKIHIRSDCRKWSSATTFHNLSLQETRDMISEVVPADQSSQPSLGSWNLLDKSLFIPSEVGGKFDDEIISNRLLNIYARWRPHLFASLILTSNVHNFNQDNIKAVLDSFDHTEDKKRSEESSSECQSSWHLLKLILMLQAEDADAETLVVAKNYLQNKLSEEILVKLCKRWPSLLIAAPDNTLTPLGHLVNQQQQTRDILKTALVHLIESKKLTFHALLQLVNGKQVQLSGSEESLLTTSFELNALCISILERLACSDKNKKHFEGIAGLLTKVYYDALCNDQSVGEVERRVKHLLPRRGGLFQLRFKWLDDLPPLQGTEALRAECQQHKLAALISCNKEEFIKEGKFCGSNDGNSNDAQCPCSSCNATLLKFQCLLCSDYVPRQLLLKLHNFLGDDSPRNLKTIRLLVKLHLGDLDVISEVIGSSPTVLPSCVEVLVGKTVSSGANAVSVYKDIIHRAFETIKNQEQQFLQSYEKPKSALKDMHMAFSTTFLSVTKHMRTPDRLDLLPADASLQFFLPLLLKD